MMDQLNHWRIAIIGGGPRGLFVLNALRDALSSSPTKMPCTITLYEPCDRPGAGLVYHPDQPRYLLMNFSVGSIDAYIRSSEHSTDDRPSLSQWLSENRDTPADDNSIESRACVGRYLHSCYQQTIESLPTCMAVTHEPRFIDQIDRTTGSWRLYSGPHIDEFDEVVITTGHQHWHDEKVEVASTVNKEIKVFNAFPIKPNLIPKNIPASSSVAVRGFALTFIDTAFALTVGRGGRFVRDSEELVYLPSGAEPSMILPCTRSGAPSLCKPDYSLIEPPSDVTPWVRASANILSLQSVGRTILFSRDIWPLIMAAADDALDAQPGTAADWFRAWSHRQWSSIETIQALQNSLSVAQGHKPKDMAWAMGETWRRLYPALVETISYANSNAFHPENFDQVSRHMERIAFGPPSKNTERLLTLINAGYVDLKQLRWFNDNSEDIWPPQADAAVQSVIPGPHDIDNLGPVGNLIDRNLLQRGNSGAILVDDCGRALVGDEVIPGLSLIGRLTEGLVLGNDTLNRTLQPQPQRWAAQAVAQWVSYEMAAVTSDQHEQ